MISLWALVSERDVEAFADSLVLPVYLAHLRLAPFRFAEQAKNVEGREPLVLCYVGDGRLEEFQLPPEEHALAMIRSVCPGIVASRLQLPRDDARWHWDDSGGPMRIYFAPTATALGHSGPRPPDQAAYVSVSRQRVFVGRPLVEDYLRAWLRRLGIDDAQARFQFATPFGGVELCAGPIAGQMLLDDVAMAEDLVRFAGLEQPLAEVRDFVRLDLAGGGPECGILDSGVSVHLARCGEDDPERP